VAKRIVVFGDSWTYGSDLVDPALIPKLESEGYGLQDAEWKYFHENVAYREKHRYSNQLSEQLNWSVENYSEPGDSLTGMRVKFIEWASKQYKISWDTIVIFALTHPDRQSYYFAEDDKWYNSGLLQYGMEDHPLHQIWKRHVAYSSCNELNMYNVKEFVMMSRAICLERHMRWVFAPVFTESKFDDPMCMPFCMREIIEIEHRNGHDVWAWGEHPNELGHKFIAKHLINFMKERKLIQ